MPRRSRGTDFWVVLDPPPNEDHYVTDSSVTGNIFLVAQKNHPEYKYIEVSLRGSAIVKIREITPDPVRNDRYRVVWHSDSETYADETLVLWSKSDTPGNQLTAGSHTFPFSFKLQFSGPPTFSSGSGRISYQIQARISRVNDTVKHCKPVQICFVPKIDVNFHREYLKPMEIQIRQIPLCWGFLCSARPISITARIPRTGYCCTGVDAIPLEVDVQNGTRMTIRYIRAKLKRLVAYIAEGYRREGNRETIAVMKSDTAILSGRSFKWKPPPFSIPKTNFTTITNSRIIKLKYYLKVEAVVFGTCNPCVKFDLLLGNVPIEGTQPTEQPMADLSSS